MVNSCLDLSAAADSRQRPFSRSYGAILPSSLAVNHSSALVYSTRPPVSVCGTGRALAFLGAMPAASLRPGARLGGASPSHLCGPHDASLPSRAGWEFFIPLPSGSPQRVTLRARLTLIRRTLIRNPQSFGEADSDRLYRYLCLHLLFTPLRRASRLRVRRGVNAPLPAGP